MAASVVTIVLFVAWVIFFILSIALLVAEQRKPVNNRKMWGAGFSFMMFAQLALLGLFLNCHYGRRRIGEGFMNLPDPSSCGPCGF